MAVTTRTSIEVLDEEPNAQTLVAVAQEVTSEGREVISLNQAGDVVWMSHEHARAVADTILSLTNSTAKE